MDLYNGDCIALRWHCTFPQKPLGPIPFCRQQQLRDRMYPLHSAGMSFRVLRELFGRWAPVSPLGGAEQTAHRAAVPLTFSPQDAQRQIPWRIGNLTGQLLQTSNEMTHNGRGWFLDQQLLACAMEIYTAKRAVSYTHLTLPTKA